MMTLPRSACLALVLTIIVVSLNSVEAQDAWDAANNAIVFNCAASNAPVAEIPFQGFKEECDDLDKAPFSPEDPDARLDLVIDRKPMQFSFLFSVDV